MKVIKRTIFWTALVFIGLTIFALIVDITHKLFALLMTLGACAAQNRVHRLIDQKED